MRVVLDPNVLVSAVVASGVSAELLDRWLTDRPFELVVCPMLLGELRGVLQRPKFRRWITADEAADFVDRLADEAESWADPTDVPSVTRRQHREKRRELNESSPDLDGSSRVSVRKPCDSQSLGRPLLEASVRIRGWRSGVFGSMVVGCPSIGDVMDTITAAPVTSFEVTERFLASYWTTRTRDNYRFILTRWLDWCHEHGYDPVGGADAAALETFIAGLKAAGYAPNTIIGRVSAMSAFYRWCMREQLVVRNPVELNRHATYAIAHYLAGGN